MAIRNTKAAAPKKIMKSHGPKRKLFHTFNKSIRIDLGRTGVLNKYNNYESFVLSCQARGMRNVSDSMWSNFLKLKTIKEKDAFLKAINN